MTRLAALLITVSLLFTLSASAGSGEGGGDPRSGCEAPVDVLFVFDTTGSMGGVLSDATTGAGAVMAAVQSQIPNAAFGVADYKDYDGTFAYPGYSSTYGGWGDYPWMLVSPVDTNAALASAAIGTLSASGGADGPESLTRAVYESYSDPLVGWRPGATRVVVLFTDAPAHDLDFAGNNYGSDPGVDATASTPDDLDFETTAAAAGAAGLRFAAVGVGGNWGAPYLQHLADETEGEYAVLGGDFASEITALILEISGIRKEAHADAVLLDVATVAAEHLDVTHVEAGPHPETHVETLNLVTLPPAVGGQLATGEGRATIQQTATYDRAAARMTIERVFVLNGLVEATLLRADASVLVDAWGAWPSDADSHFAQVWIAGTPITVSAPNTVVALPGGLGYVVLDERIVNQPSPTTAEVEVNSIHVVLTAGAVVGDIKISHAYAGIICGSEHDDGPTPPIDPVSPVGPIVPPVDPTTPVRPPCLPASLTGVAACVDPAPACIDLLALCVAVGTLR